MSCAGQTANRHVGPKRARHCVLLSHFRESGCLATGGYLFLLLMFRCLQVYVLRRNTQPCLTPATPALWWGFSVSLRSRLDLQLICVISLPLSLSPSLPLSLAHSRSDAGRLHRPPLSPDAGKAPGEVQQQVQR